MNRIGVMIGLAALLSISCVSFAKEPPGLKKQGKVPPGFSKGKKVGWQSDHPPGWNKKSEIEQGQWKDAVKKARDSILGVAEENGLNAEEALFAADDFEKAARIGMVPDEAENLLKDMIRKGKKGDELSVLAAEEAEKLIKEKGREGKRDGDSGKNMDKGKKPKGKKK